METLSNLTKIVKSSAISSAKQNELKALISLSLETKILFTKEKIQEWYEHHQGKVYVSFSGGKDSTVLLHLVRSLYPDVPAVFVDTGLEYPEIKEFVKTFSNVETLRPKHSFKTVLEKYGYPVVSKRVAQYVSEIQTRTGKNENTIKLRMTGVDSSGRSRPHGMISKKWKYLKDAPFKISDKCCHVMKKAPFKKYSRKNGSFPFVGTMVGDSSDRALSWLRNGCNAFDTNSPQSRPMSIWTEQDLFQFVIKEKIEICSVYGSLVESSGRHICSGVQRTGCVFCAFGADLEQRNTGTNRFKLLYHSHPKLWAYCMDDLGMAKVLQHVHVNPYPQSDLFEWAGGCHD